jgi:hypothetical protein
VIDQLGRTAVRGSAEDDFGRYRIRHQCARNRLAGLTSAGALTSSGPRDHDRLLAAERLSSRDQFRLVRGLKLAAWRRRRQASGSTTA